MHPQIFKFRHLLPSFKSFGNDPFVGRQLARCCHSSNYVQGQVLHFTREHFYCIDNEGRVFLDDDADKTPDRAMKNKMMLKFLVSGIQPNKTGRYPEFDYISLRGAVRSFVRCQHLPIVFTQVAEDRKDKNKLLLTICNSPITAIFEPKKLCLDPHTNHVFHPAYRAKDEVGMVSESISSAWKAENRFGFEDGDSNPATHFTWNGQKIKLTNELLSVLDIVQFRRDRLKRMK